MNDQYCCACVYIIVYIFRHLLHVLFTYLCISLDVFRFAFIGIVKIAIRCLDSIFWIRVYLPILIVLKWCLYGR